MPQRRCATSPYAATPTRVAHTLSYAVGLPPRCVCPSTVTRVSWPVRSSIIGCEALADAALAQLRVAEGVRRGARIGAA